MTSFSRNRLRLDKKIIIMIENISHPQITIFFVVRSKMIASQIIKQNLPESKASSDSVPVSSVRSATTKITH